MRKMANSKIANFRSCMVVVVGGGGEKYLNLASHIYWRARHHCLRVTLDIRITMKEISVSGHRVALSSMTGDLPV